MIAARPRPNTMRRGRESAPLEPLIAALTGGKRGRNGTIRGFPPPLKTSSSPFYVSFEPDHPGIRRRPVASHAVGSAAPGRPHRVDRIGKLHQPARPRIL